MKVNFIKLVLALLIFTGINSYSATIWENITFPTVSSSITAIAVRGNYIYLGTSADGFFYSSDAGKNWQQPENKLNTINIKLIATKGTDLVFVFSDQQVYTSSDNCKTWVKHSWFMEVEEIIQCFAFGPSGNLYLGTDKNVWKSTDDGARYTKISTPLEKVDVQAIAVNGREYIYISNFLGDAGEIYRTKNGGTAWEAAHNGISPPYKAKSIYVCTGDRLYCQINNSIYTSTDYGDNWTQIETPIKDLPIKRMRPNRNGDLIVVQGKKVSIWDIAKRKWLSNQDQLLLPADISDLVINDDDGKILVISREGIYKSKVGIGDYIHDYNLSYIFAVEDYSARIPNTTFNLFINGVYAGQVTTDAEGTFSTYGYTTTFGDKIRVETKIHTEYTVKAGHENMNNIMYEVYIDNTKFDSKGKPSDYILTTDFEPVIMLDHTTLRYNLLISVEWDADAEFLDTLKSQCRKLSNYLYDVTDGQLYFNQVDIYDNSEQWDNCDMRIYTNNMCWPNASVGAIHETSGAANMPRLWMGDSDPSRNTTARDDWLTKLASNHFKTMGHELGHYLFNFWDEYVYVDTVMAKKIPKGYNFGFMQFQYDGGGKSASEMSSADNYSIDYFYKCTAQWYYNKMDCWSQFETEHQVIYGNHLAVIYKPRDRVDTYGFILEGPNDYLQYPDYNVGKLMYGDIHNANLGAGTADVICYLGNGPFPNVDATLMKSYDIFFKWLGEGRTSDGGKIKILGARVGDNVRCYYLDANQNEIWNSVVEIYGVTPFLKTESLPPIEVQMKRAEGDFLLNNELRYNENRKLEFVSRPLKEFDNPPEIEVEFKESGPKTEKFPFDNKLGGYKYQFTGGMDSKFTSNLILYDVNKSPISIPVEFMQNAKTLNVHSLSGGLLLTLDSKNSSGIDNVPVANTALFSSRGGLNKDAERGSDIFYIASYPSKFASNSSNLLTLRYDKSKLVKKADTLLKIYRWDYDKLTWVRLGGQIDTAQKAVTIPINSTGCYALFTYDPASGVNDNKDRGMLDLNISPNPAKDYATVSFVLEDAEYVTIGITNALGIEVAKVMDNQLLAYGRREFKIPCGSLPSGVYFCTVKAGNVFETIKLMVNY